MECIEDHGVASERSTKRLYDILRNGIAALVFAAALLPSIAWSAETVVPVTPPGSTDVDQATLPPPGTYFGAVWLPFSANSNTFGSDGKAVPPQYNLHISSQIFAPIGLYVYHFKLLGGAVGSSLVQPIAHVDFSVGSSATTSRLGTQDAYSDIIYWSKNVGLLGATAEKKPISYGLSVAAGFALIIPTGSYTKNDVIRLGGHSWVLDPNVALTYNTGPRLSFGDNTQLSTRIFYAMPQRNWTTLYTSGRILDVDYSATEQFRSLRVGVAGFYQNQLTDDHPGDGAKLPNGNRFTSAGAGPVFEYFIPKTSVFLKLKYTDIFEHKNYVDQQFAVLSAGFKF